MAAMEHHKRSKAASGIIEHRGGEQGAERAANTIAPAQPCRSTLQSMLEHDQEPPPAALQSARSTKL